MIAGVDIGGTKIAVGIVGENGRVLAKAECPTDVPSGFDQAMQRVRAFWSSANNRPRSSCAELESEVPVRLTESLVN